MLVLSLNVIDADTYNNYNYYTLHLPALLGESDACLKPR